MNEKFQALVNKAKSLMQEKPRYFYLNLARVVSGLIFLIVVMLPFYSGTLLGVTARFNIFDMKVSFIYFLVFLGLPFAVAYFAIIENKKNLRLFVLIETILSIVLIVFFFLAFLIERSDSNLITFRLSIGFYLSLLSLTDLILLTWKEELMIKLLGKFIKFKHEDVVEAEIVEVEQVEVKE